MYCRSFLCLSSVIRLPSTSQSRSLMTLLTVRRDLPVPLSSQVPVRLLSDAAPSPGSKASLGEAERSTSTHTNTAAEKAAKQFESYGPIPSPPARGILYSVTQEDIDTYLKPMYARRWAVRLNNRQLSSKRGTLFLAKAFRLVDYDTAMSFFNDIASIVQEENHHPEIAFSHSTVKVQTQTHHIAGPTIAVPNASEKIPRIPPGITPNDARLAIRIEKLFADIYIANGRARATYISAIDHTPGTLEEMKQLAPNKG